MSAADWFPSIPWSTPVALEVLRVERHRLPRLSGDERTAIAGLVPRSPLEIRQEIEEDAFLKGEQP